MSEIDLSLQDPTNYEVLFIEQCVNAGTDGLFILSAETLIAFIMLGWLGLGSLVLLYRSTGIRRGCASVAELMA